MRLWQGTCSETTKRLQKPFMFCWRLSPCMVPDSFRKPSGIWSILHLRLVSTRSLKSLPSRSAITLGTCSLRTPFGCCWKVTVDAGVQTSFGRLSSLCTLWLRGVLWRSKLCHWEEFVFSRRYTASQAGTLWDPAGVSVLVSCPVLFGWYIRFEKNLEKASQSFDMAFNPEAAKPEEIEWMNSLTRKGSCVGRAREVHRSHLLLWASAILIALFLWSPLRNSVAFIEQEQWQEAIDVIQTFLLAYPENETQFAFETRWVTCTCKFRMTKWLWKHTPVF